MAQRHEQPGQPCLAALALPALLALISGCSPVESNRGLPAVPTPAPATVTARTPLAEEPVQARSTRFELALQPAPAPVDSAQARSTRYVLSWGSSDDN